MRRRLSIVLIVALALVGCSDSDATELTTTSSATSDTSVPSGGGGTTLPDDENDGDEPAPPGGPTTTLRGEAITEHRQVHTESTPNGPVIHLVIPRGGYTDIDIENFIRDIRHAQPGLWGVELFDNPNAQAAFMVTAANRTDDQRTLLSRHHLVTLTEGETLIWRGPLSSLGQSTIGS